MMATEALRSGTEHPVASTQQQQGMFAKFARAKSLAKTKSAPDLGSSSKNNVVVANRGDEAKAKQTATASSIAQLEAELRRENEKLERLMDRKKKRRLSLKAKEMRGDAALQSDEKEEAAETKRRSKRQSSSTPAKDDKKKEKKDKKKKEKKAEREEKKRRKREKRLSGPAAHGDFAIDRPSAAATASSYSLNEVQAARILKEARITPATTARAPAHSTSPMMAPSSSAYDDKAQPPPLSSVRFRDLSEALASATTTTTTTPMMASAKSATAVPLSARGTPSASAASSARRKSESGSTSRAHRATVTMAGSGVPMVLGGVAAAVSGNDLNLGGADGDYMKKMARHELQAYQQSKGDEGVLRRAIRNKYLLHVSVEAGHEDVVRFLVNNKKLKLNTPDAMGWTPLHCACAAGHVNIILFLLSKKRTNVQKVTSDGCTALHYLIRHFPDPFATNYNELLEKYSDVANRLVSIGCDVNATNRNGETVLHYAAFRGKSTAVRFLLAHKDWDIDINATTNAGETALHLACYSGSLDTVNALLESGAATNIVGINGTPLDIAKRQNDKRLVMALLKHKQKREPSQYRLNRDDAQYLGYAYSSAGEDGDMDETTDAEFISDVEPEQSGRGSGSGTARDRGRRPSVVASTPGRAEREEEDLLLFGSNKAVALARRDRSSITAAMSSPQRGGSGGAASPKRPVAAVSSPWRRSLVLLESEKIASPSPSSSSAAGPGPAKPAVATTPDRIVGRNLGYRASMHVSSPIRALPGLAADWDLDPAGGGAGLAHSTESHRLLGEQRRRHERRRQSAAGTSARRRRSKADHVADVRRRDRLGRRRDSTELSSSDDVQGKGKEKADDDDLDNNKAGGRRVGAESARFEVKPRWEEEQDEAEEQDEDDDEGKSSSSSEDAARAQMQSRERQIRLEDEEDRAGRLIHVLGSDDDRKTTTADDDEDDEDDNNNDNDAERDDDDVDSASLEQKRRNMRRVTSFDEQLARKKKNTLSRSQQHATALDVETAATKKTKKASSKRLSSAKSEGEGISDRVKKAKKRDDGEDSERAKAKKKKEKKKKSGSARKTVKTDDVEREKTKSKKTKKTKKTKKARVKEESANEERKIRAWLEELHLPIEYLNLLKQDGFDDMKTIQLITEEELADIGISKTGHRKRIMRWVKQHPASPVYSPRGGPPSTAIFDVCGSSSSAGGSFDFFAAAGAPSAAAGPNPNPTTAASTASGVPMGSRLSSFSFSPFAFLKARNSVSGAGSGSVELFRSPHSISIDSPKEEQARRLQQQHQQQQQASRQLNGGMPHSISIDSPREERARKLRLKLQRNSLAAPLVLQPMPRGASSPALSARGAARRDAAAVAATAGPAASHLSAMTARPAGSGLANVSSSSPPVRRKHEAVPLSPVAKSKKRDDSSEEEDDEGSSGSGSDFDDDSDTDSEAAERRLYATSPVASPRKVTIAATPAAMLVTRSRVEPHKVYVRNNVQPTSGAPLSPRKHQITPIPIPTTTAKTSSTTSFLSRLPSSSPTSSSTSSPSSSPPSASGSPSLFCTPTSPRLPAFTRKPLPRPPQRPTTPRS